MIWVLGPGALGGLLAGLLHEGGLEVALLARDAEQVAPLAEQGLLLSGPGQAPPRRLRPPVQVGPVGPPPELLLLCVKAGDTAAALAPLGALPGVSVGVLQNGLGRAEHVADLLGEPERILGVLTTEGATRRGPGRVHHAGRGRTRVAPLVPAGEARATRVAELLAGVGLAAETAPELAPLVWEKLGVNAAINALTGLLGCRNGGLLAAPAAAALADAAADEVAALARARGIPGDWSDDGARARWREVVRGTGENVSSTLQDLRRGARSEVHGINGAVAQAAREAGLRASANEMLARLIEAREQLAALDPPPPMSDSRGQ